MPLRKILDRVRAAEQGFSMVVTMGAVAMLLATSAVAVSAVAGDQSVGRTDRDRKEAYAAAEAGLQVYVHKLLIDNTYWAKCAIAADGLNQPWQKPVSTDPMATPIPQSADPRTWKNLPDNSAAYTIESLPVPGVKLCDVKDPEGSMVADGAPTFRIRVTGQSMLDGERLGPKRSLIATFKRKSFLDYIYFTDIEAQDPTLYKQALAKGDDTRENAGLDINTPAKQRDIVQWGNDACSKYSYQKFVANKGESARLREDQLFRGTGPSAGKKKSTDTTYTSWSAGCVEIQFVAGDWIYGPMHTNDSPLLCGNPKFGRKPSDVIEVSGPADTKVTDVSQSWRESGNSACGSSAPQVNFESTTNPDPNLGTWKFNQKVLQLPQSNLSLKSEAPPAYQFVGETHIKLTALGITVSGTRKDGSILNNQILAYPADGVIYVDNGLCNATYSTADPYADRSGCGIADVSGHYLNDSLTIAAADDIVVEDDIIKDAGGTGVLGLVSNNFIRLKHPLLNATQQAQCAAGTATASLTNGPGSQDNPRIDAALLALRHSFIVDNWACGAPLGTLFVNGAIAQKFRGPVGTGNGKSASTGYLKKYSYDDRLRVRIPPKFIDPVQSAWGIQTYQEQAPAE